MASRKYKQPIVVYYLFNSKYNEWKGPYAMRRPTKEDEELISFELTKIK